MLRYRPSAESTGERLRRSANEPCSFPCLTVPAQREPERVPEKTRLSGSPGNENPLLASFTFVADEWPGPSDTVAELPCVATPLALQGLDAEPGNELLVGETDKQLADQTLAILNRKIDPRRLGRAARAYVQSRRSWTNAAKQYDELYAEIGARQRRS